MKLRLISLLLIGIILTAGFSGCAQSGPAVSSLQSGTPDSGTPVAGRTVTLLDWSEVTVPGEVNRVAVLFGPSYEKVFLLGCEDKIIADGDFHINGWLWSNVIYKRLNSIPGVPNAHADLNMEELAKMSPDLVFYFNKPQQVEEMRKLGISVIPAVSSNPNQSKFTDQKATINVYAQALGDDKALKRAQDYAQYFDEKLAMITAVTSGIPESDRPKVYFANQKLLWAQAKSSDKPETVNLAGGVCVSQDLPGGGQTEITMEQLIQWDPDYIIIDHAGSSGNASAEEVIKSMTGDARFDDLTAVRKNQVAISPTGVFFWDSGVQEILQVMWMAKMFHPDKFSDLDIKQELKDFYARFFDYSLTDVQADRILQHLDP